MNWDEKENEAENIANQISFSLEDIDAIHRLYAETDDLADLTLKTNDNPLYYSSKNK